jgi:secreted PhoX family phosphatase
MELHNPRMKSRRDLLRIDDGDHGIARPGLIVSEPGRAPQNERFRNVVVRYLERRTFLKGAATLVPGIVASSGLLAASEAKAQSGNTLTFQPIRPSTADQVIVPNGYDSDVLIRWGDPLLHNAPPFDPNNQTAAAQRLQFGYNCDFIGYFPFSNNTDKSKRALLCVNHEYTTGGDMFPGYVAGSSKQIADVEIAAHGGSVVEIALKENGWRYVKKSPFNRRITGDTPITITGPAAGHPLMRTSADPQGKTVLGMLNNCSGGKTPWGTWLTCEENFNQYFANNSLVANAEIQAIHTRYGLPNLASSNGWEKFYDRFDLAHEPNEAFRFGWVVEIDPYNADFQPRKHTALGRLKHEAATVAVSRRGRAVVYTGDDERFDYVYKFVSRDKIDWRRSEANHELLDNGTLYVAKFHDDSTGEWLPLTINNPALAGKFSS